MSTGCAFRSVDVYLRYWQKELWSAWTDKPSLFVHAIQSILFLSIYSRTSMTRTLMVRLPRLVRTRSWVPWNKVHSCKFGIITNGFLFYIEKWYMVCTRWGDSNESTQYTFILKKIEKISLLYHLTWRIINPKWLELPLSRTNFHSPKGVRANEVRLYMVNEKWVDCEQHAKMWWLIWFLIFCFQKNWSPWDRVVEAGWGGDRDGCIGVGRGGRGRGARPPPPIIHSHFPSISMWNTGIPLHFEIGGTFSLIPYFCTLNV